MSWTTALLDLRTIISDGPQDKYCFNKPILGISNGTNTRFKTFDRRIVTDFTAPGAGEGVFVNDVLATVTSTIPELGVVVLRNDFIPNEGDRVTASYYFQWFDDSQLTTYLSYASTFMGFASDFTVIPPGLQPAAIQYAAADCYQELSVRFARMVSEGYRMEDLPKEALENLLKSYQAATTQCRKAAVDLRKGFYTRQNQPDQAYSDNISGTARAVEPNA